MYGISLFSGVGGLELALYEEVKTVAYVEREPYAQAVLIKRIQEGLLPDGPIYDDVRSFDGRKYRGLVDIVFGGFPCQDISNAGKGRGIKEGTRSGLWFEMLRVINEVAPALVFIENGKPRQRVLKYFGRKKPTKAAVKEIVGEKRK